MAKGDDKRSRNQIDYQKGMAQNHMDNLREDMIIPQAQNAQNWYDLAKRRSFDDYDSTMGQFQNFADTGGYSTGDLSNIRSRALSPLRAIYANANREVDRQRTLQGGYSPGFGVLKARMAREQSQGVSDAATNAEAQIAQMLNEGKRFGVQGRAGLYGTTPGLAGHFGGMQNATMNNWLNTNQLQNNLGLGIIGAQLKASEIPGAWQQGFNNLMKGVEVASGAITPWDDFIKGKG